MKAPTITPTPQYRSIFFFQAVLQAVVPLAIGLVKQIFQCDYIGKRPAVFIAFQSICCNQRKIPLLLFSGETHFLLFVADLIYENIITRFNSAANASFCLSPPIKRFILLFILQAG